MIGNISHKEMNFSPKVNLEVFLSALTFNYENEGKWQIGAEFTLFR